MKDRARQEDFVFAEHVLRRGFATEQQVEECLKLLERLRGEMELDESLENILLKKGYLAVAQAQVIRQAISPAAEAGAAKNQIEGYRLLARLGSGAMGSVYKAHHAKLNIPVALKVLRVDLAKSKTQIERLKREAQLAARLNHPNIVRSLDVGESNGFHYFAMEFVDGATVRHLLRKGRIREKDALRILRDVVRGLEHAHAEGVVHRDIKPGNIMLTRESAVKLGDFGLARGREPSDLTLDHASIGTPQYVAPEQVRRGSDANARSDLFSCGATLYHMVTGRPPFSGETLGEIISKAVQCEFEPPEKVAPDLAVDTVYVIHRLMRKHPRERYGSATELLADLERVLRGERIAPPDFRGDYRAYLRRRFQRRAATAAGAAVVLLVCTFYVVQRMRENRREQERVAACEAVNAEGKGVVEELDEAAGLEEQLARMEARRAAQECEPEWVADLDLRIVRTRADLGSLEKAMRIKERTKATVVDWRQIDQDLATIPANMPGTKRRLEAVRGEVRGLSDAEAKERWDTACLRGWPDPDVTVEKLAELVRDVDERYLPVEWGLQLKASADALRTLRDEYAAAERTHGPRYQRALEDKRFAAAAVHFEILRKERAAARRKAEAKRVSEALLAPFPVEGDREAELVLAEGNEYARVSKDVDEKVGQGRPDLAERQLEGFLQNAHKTEAQARANLARVQKERERRLKEQDAEIDAEEALFTTRLRNRNYAAAWESVDRLQKVRILGAAQRFEALRRRANAVQGLWTRFLDGVGREKEIELDLQSGGSATKIRFPGTALELRGGDRFQVAAGGQTWDVSLGDFPYELLLRILAFDPARPKDVEQRGYFEFAEAFRDDRSNPPLALAHRREAQAALRGDPEWAALLDQLIGNTEKHIANEEARARQLWVSFDEALKLKENPRALALCEDLLRLAWTDFVKPKVVYLKDRSDELRRLTGHETLRLKVGVPPENFELDPESGEATIRVTGAAWYPDVQRVPAGLAGEERERWLDEAARKFWHGWFRSRGEPEERLEEMYQRARRQLLAWEGPIESVDPGYRLLGEVLDNQKAWWDERLDDARKREAWLAHRFRADRNWSIELTAEWEMPEPGYFAIGIGGIQAGFARVTRDWRQEGRPELLYGGASGACLFEEPDMVEAPQDRPGPFSETFDWQYVRDPKHRKKLEGKHKAYLDDFVEGTPYRMRLERVGFTLKFRAVPLPRWEKSGFEGALLLESKNFGGHALEKHVSGNPFRFFCRVRCTLRDVVMRGTLAGDGP